MPQTMLPNPLGAMQQGQDLRRQRTQNALGDLALQNAPAQYERENELNRRDDRQYQQGLDKEQAMQGIAAAQHAMQASDTRAFIEQNFPEVIPQLQQHGFDPNSPDEDWKEMAAEFAAQLQASIGMGPATQEQYTLNPGDVRMQGDQQIAAAPAAQPATPQPTDDMREYGLARTDPAFGEYMAAQRAPQTPEALESVVDPNTGKPTLVPRSQAAGREPYQKPTGGLSPRDATTAHNKLTQIALARSQVAIARQKFDAIRGTFSAGPGGQFVPTPAGEAFDTAVDAMRSTITGLKRVPGVGAMSDYETRLDQSMIPHRGKYEQNTGLQLDELEMMLNHMEQGYAGLLSDAGMQTQDTTTTAAQPVSNGGTVAPEGTVIQGRNGQKLVKRGGQWVPQ